jgi:transcription initiation factor TFIIB
MSGLKCVECNAEGFFDYDYREGNITCKCCGRVQQSGIIDETSEYRNFAKDSTSRGGEDPRRVGEANNDLLSDRGLYTLISSVGNKPTPLARWAQRSTQIGTDRTLVRGFRTIDQICHRLNLNDRVAEEAKKIFKEVGEQRQLKGRAHEAVMSAIIFLACGNLNNPYSLREIAMISNCEIKQISKCYSLIKKLAPSVSNNISSPLYYAGRFAVKLGFPEALKRAATEVARRAVEKGIVTGKHPMSIASAAVYLVSQMTQNYKKTFGEVSEKSSMKDVTIRNCYRVMFPYRFELAGGFGQLLNPANLPDV